jgi:hypothetical protein
VIDSAQHEIRPLRHQRFDSQHHTVGGSAVNLKSSFAALDRANRMMQRQGMTRRALLTIRSNDGDLTKRLGGFDQAGESKGKNPIVVGAE